MSVTWHFDSPCSAGAAFEAYAKALLPLATPERPIAVDRDSDGVRITCHGVSSVCFDDNANAWVDGPIVAKRVFHLSFTTYRLSDISDDGGPQAVLRAAVGARQLREFVEFVRAPHLTPPLEFLEIPATELVRPLVPFFRDRAEFAPTVIGHVDPSRLQPTGFSCVVDVELVAEELRAHAKAGVYWMAPLYVCESATDLVAHARANAEIPAEGDSPPEDSGFEWHDAAAFLRAKGHRPALAKMTAKARLRIASEAERPFDRDAQYLMRLRRRGRATSFPVAPFLWLTASGASVVEVAAEHSATFVERLLASEKGAELDAALSAAFRGHTKPLRNLRLRVPARGAQLAQGLAFASGARVSGPGPDRPYSLESTYQRQCWEGGPAPREDAADHGQVFNAIMSDYMNARSPREEILARAEWERCFTQTPLDELDEDLWHWRVGNLLALATRCESERSPHCNMIVTL